MREIEFRGKFLYGDKEWKYGEFHHGCIESDRNYDIDLNTLGQYTGLKDKNGKKIFEGDIIHIEEENLYGLICFENCQWYVYYYGWIDKEGIGYVYDIVNENPLADELLTNENKIWLSVVGNKYDNPELLEVEK